MEIISNTEEYLIHIINIKGRNVSKHHSRNSMSAISRLICTGEALTQLQPTHGWFVILNTIVLNIKKQQLSYKNLCQHASQANWVFVELVLNRWKFCYLFYRLRCMGADRIFTKNTKLTRHYLLALKVHVTGEGVTKIYSLNHKFFNCWFYLQGRVIVLNRVLVIVRYI